MGSLAADWVGGAVSADNEVLREWVLHNGYEEV